MYALFDVSEIIRTRDTEVLKALDILVDVGSIYDPATFVFYETLCHIVILLKCVHTFIFFRHRYDHHQAGFTHTFDDKHKIKLSSAGLVYKHFGREVVSGAMRLDISNPAVELIYQRVYDRFIEALDGIDNGVHQYPAEIAPAYRSNTDLSSRVAGLNPRWNEPEDDLDARFQRAMALTGSELVDAINYYWKTWFPARTIVEKALQNRKQFHPSGEIMVLDQFCPWKDHLYDLEAELGLEEPLVKYCLFQDSSKQWRVQCVSIRPDSFENRRSLPAPWRGKRDVELSQLSGIPDCVFVHATGFIGGNKTFEGALKMATTALSFLP